MMPREVAMKFNPTVTSEKTSMQGLAVILADTLTVKLSEINIRFSI